MCGEMYSRLATAPFVSPSATSSDTARSVAVRLSQPLAGRRLGPRGPGRMPRARNCARTRPAQASPPAGVGKSRLGWEFEKYADGLKAQVWWHRGRCPAYGDGVAFWALAEMVRQRLGIAEEDPADIAAGKLAAGLEEFVPDPAERAYVGLRLSRLLGVAFVADSGGALGREELFAGWRLFFERLAAEGPVVLLIEDAQHADAGLLDFLEHLTDWARDLPIFVLVLARPELGQARSRFGAGRNRTALTLDPLDAASMDQLVEALVPGMPPPARAAVTAQAQGIPLFAVETVRSLIDRDIVQPVEGVYRLVGEVGDLAVPDSLHALLAARLDALDSPVRRLVADAAVLGTTFPAEALIAVSGQDEPVVRAALDELVRREVLTVSADPLSPEKGSYGFAQNMLRQVAYDTLSRRDRKIRHLAVAAHLRAAFPGDGEEVAEVIARHYLDALESLPDDPDAGQIRGQAIAALTRAAERAERTGAPAQAATSYATAAQLTQPRRRRAADGRCPVVGTRRAGHPHHRRLGRGGRTGRPGRGAVPARRRYPARRPRPDHRRAGAAPVGTARPGPRAAHRRRGGAAGRPGTDTVQALGELATLEVFAGAPEADALTAEALALGQDLAVDDATLAQLFTTRGLWHTIVGRRPQAAANFREAVRLATQAGDALSLDRALVNLADTVTVTDPAAAAEAARAAAAHARRAGARNDLATAVVNLAQALLMTGDWDAAETELAQAIDGDGLAAIEFAACYRAWLAALRGDTPAAQAILAGLSGLRTSEDPQDQATIAVAEAFTAAARLEPAAALSQARAVLGHVGALEISHESVRWAWPLAARAAHDLTDTATTTELLALLDRYRPGQLALMQRAERALARARLAATDGEADPGAAFTVAIAGLREHSTPTTWLTACSTTPRTSPRSATPKPPKQPSLKPATSPPGCAASRCSTAPKLSSPSVPALRLRDWRMSRLAPLQRRLPPQTGPLSRMHRARAGVADWLQAIRAAARQDGPFRHIQLGSCTAN